MKLLLVGDVMLGRLVNRILRYESPDYAWGDTLPIFYDADWRACNLECVISDRGIPWMATPKAFYFRSDAKNVAVLKAAKIDVVSLANNHILDFEYEALSDTSRILDDAGIMHAGAGVNREEARRPAITEIQGIKIGLIAFTDNEPEWEAIADRPGLFYVPVDPADPRARDLFNLVGQARGQADLVVVSAHWGPNWGYEPPMEHIPFAHTLIDSGADIIFGHSGHVFRGIEIYKSRPILYCTGDLIDDYAVDKIERNDQSFIFIVERDKKRVSRVLLYPVVIKDFQARRAISREEKEVVGKIQKLCSKFYTNTWWNEDEARLEILI